MIVLPSVETTFPAASTITKLGIPEIENLSDSLSLRGSWKGNVNQGIVS